jgi:hypothetical protein
MRLRTPLSPLTQSFFKQSPSALARLYTLSLQGKTAPALPVDQFLLLSLKHSQFYYN